MLLKELPLLENFEKIKTEVYSLLEQHKNPYQLCLQGRTENFLDWGDGTGSIKEDESIFCNLHPSLQGSEIEKVIKRHSGLRTRIMRMNQKYCYSVHKDKSKRIHIPITTNEHAWMVWPYDQFCARLEEGKMYLTDTTRLHSFFNGATVDRIHLVMCVY